MHQPQGKNQVRDRNIDREHTQQKRRHACIDTDTDTEQLNITIYGIEMNTDPTN